MERTIRCPRCRETFMFEHYSGGSIEHENHTSAYNLEVDLERGEFIESTNLELDNYCNVKDITTSTMEKIKTCRLLWLEHRDPVLWKEAVKFFNSRENDLALLLGGCSKEDRDTLSYYWARANRLLTELKPYRYVEIKKVKAISGHQYIAIVDNNETIVLDL